MEDAHTYTKPLWNQKLIKVDRTLNIVKVHTAQNPRQDIPTGIILAKQNLATDQSGNVDLMHDIKASIEKTILAQTTDRLVYKQNLDMKESAKDAVIFFMSKKVYEAQLKHRVENLLSSLNEDMRQKLGLLATDLILNSLYNMRKPSIDDIVKFAIAEASQPMIEKLF